MAQAEMTSESRWASWYLLRRDDMVLQSSRVNGLCAEQLTDSSCQPAVSRAGTEVGSMFNVMKLTLAAEGVSCSRM